ncbi:hypothetical protein [Stygiolobus sp. CP8521M]|uniref:hypothetical protein n=1 Tax=Stygiolobus sp. CP8521M TaxID=3133136 RepID=UPI00307CD297
MEEQPLSPSFKGLELGNESPPFKGEWFSDPPDCPLYVIRIDSRNDEPSGREPSPFQGGEEISSITSLSILAFSCQTLVYVNTKRAYSLDYSLG